MSPVERFRGWDSNRRLIAIAATGWSTLHTSPPIGRQKANRTIRATLASST